jgi:hypothetical protein
VEVYERAFMLRRLFPASLRQHGAQDAPTVGQGVQVALAEQSGTLVTGHLGYL